MKSNLPKIFLTAFIGILIFPQVSFAAWWNPFTWKIFNRTPTAKVQEAKQPSEIEKLRSEVEELKKKTATPAPSAVKPSVVVGDKSNAATKPVTPVAKPVVTATELKKQNPQEYKTLVDENKTKLLEASKLLSNKNIIARVKPSVVYIETASGSGSGIIISADGYVLTNAHVVSGANSATVKLTNGASYSGSVVGRDENADLALLKISASELSAASLGDSDSVEQGDPVFTFGYPLGIEGDVAFKDGTLSRRQKINGTSYLEISAQILPGNSGGPLVNQAGEVIGVNTLAIGALKVSGVLIGETLKFALPINVAKGLIPDLKNGRNVVIPKAPVITQEPTPTVPPPQPYTPPAIITPAPTPTQPQPSPIAPPTYIPAPVPPPVASIVKDLAITANKTSVPASGYEEVLFKIDYTENGFGKHTKVEFIAPDPSKNRIFDHEYGCRTYSDCSFHASYIIPAQSGTYTFIFRAEGLEKTINISAVPYVKIDPEIRDIVNSNCDPDCSTPSVLEINSGEEKNIGSFTISQAEEATRFGGDYTYDSDFPKNQSFLRMAYISNTYQLKVTAQKNTDGLTPGIHTVTLKDIGIVGLSSGQKRQVLGLPIIFTFEIKDIPSPEIIAIKTTHTYSGGQNPGVIGLFKIRMRPKSGIKVLCDSVRMGSSDSYSAYIYAETPMGREPQCPTSWFGGESKIREFPTDSEGVSTVQYSLWVQDLTPPSDRMEFRIEGLGIRDQKTGLARTIANPLIFELKIVKP